MNKRIDWEVKKINFKGYIPVGWEPFHAETIEKRFVHIAHRDTAHPENDRDIYDYVTETFIWLKRRKR